MPPRSFYLPPDFSHVEEVLKDAHAVEDQDERLRYFRDNGVAPLFDEASIAQVVGVEDSLIFGIISNRKRHYREFYIRQKNGKRRKISAPRTYLKVIQWWILDNILASYSPPSYVYGFVRGRSAFSNAKYHLGAKHILNVDIKDFFPSIIIRSVRSAFSGFGYDRDVSSQLSKICTFRGRLPQGAPTSPALANIVVKEMDIKLRKMARNNGCKYSRYADDITFSAEDRIPVNVKNNIQEVINYYGFSINDSKSRFLGQGDRLEVTGFTINEDVRLSRKWRNKYRSFFYKVIQDPDAHVGEIDRIRGALGVIQMSTLDRRSHLMKSGLAALEVLLDRLE